ncbi:hypothetical protein tpqmel_0172 [Candidatus Gastranaerophilus sp. (ex Termes propinquus)]|nr:hypothetical protein tpqmel_0172 [Candidatus Gastranaerophilus sp. (ex Termes propinquus)]
MASPFDGKISGKNIFAAKRDEEEETAAPEPTVETIESTEPEISNRRRLNDLDGNILVSSFSLKNKEESPLRKFFFKLVPKVYTKKLVSEALCELTKLSKVANDIITKQIPYGEQDATYEDLITYLNSANNIHSKLKGKI